jgi:NTE family protein
MAKVGLVLSGGASKCIAHLGVVEALNEIGVEIGLISAVSGGALFGSIIAAGVSPKETLEIVTQKADFSFYFPSFSSGGFFTMSRIEKLYEETLPVTKFEDLKIPLIVTATDINGGKSKYFQHGSLIKPVMASSSYPIIFEPIEIHGIQYLDGGITNNFPVEIASEKMDTTIGSYVGSIDNLGKGSSVKRLMFRSLSLAISEGDKHRTKLCDVLIKPLGLGKYPMFDFSAGKEIFDVGYKATMEKSSEIAQLIG